MHPYMESSPGCWHVYGEILARQFTDPAPADVRRHTADAFAVTHPGQQSPVAIQSVCGHLMSLCVVFERTAPHSYADRILGEVVQGHVTLHWLTPPQSFGEITVVDVRQAGSADDFRLISRAWAHSAWNAWAKHHGTIREWVGKLTT